MLAIENVLTDEWKSDRQIQKEAGLSSLDSVRVEIMYLRKRGFFIDRKRENNGNKRIIFWRFSPKFRTPEDKWPCQHPKLEWPSCDGKGCYWHEQYNKCGAVE